MKESFNIEFEVLKGKSTKPFSNEIARWIRQLKDGRYNMKGAPYEFKPSNDQYALIHVYAKIFSDDTGYTIEESKDHLKSITNHFNLARKVDTNEEYEQYKSFRCSMRELTRIIDEAYNYLTHDRGMNVPTPEQWKKMTPEQKETLRQTGFRYE